MILIHQCKINAQPKNVVQLETFKNFNFFPVGNSANKNMH